MLPSCGRSEANPSQMMAQFWKIFFCPPHTNFGLGGYVEESNMVKWMTVAFLFFLGMIS